MSGVVAIDRAVTLLRDPLCVAWMRKERLPHDVFAVLRVLAGDADAESEAVRVTGKPVELIREAAAFYATQILFHSTSDPYRLLGARPEATRSELRSNLALLLRWLHPDIAGSKHRGAAERVIAAWNSLKESDTRLVVDADLARRREDSSRRRKAASSGKTGGSRVPASRRLQRRALVAGKRGHASRTPSRRKLVVILACLVGCLAVSTFVSNEPVASVQQLIAMFYQPDAPVQSVVRPQGLASPRAELAR